MRSRAACMACLLQRGVPLWLFEPHGQHACVEALFLSPPFFIANKPHLGYAVKTADAAHSKNPPSQHAYLAFPPMQRALSPVSRLLKAAAPAHPSPALQAPPSSIRFVRSSPHRKGSLRPSEIPTRYNTEESAPRQTPSKSLPASSQALKHQAAGSHNPTTP